jgi:glycosyltransferase 2 family protein
MTATPSRSTFRRFGVPLVGASISLVAIWLATRGIDIGATVAILGHVRPAPLLVVVAALSLQLGVRSLRWSLLLPSGPAGRVPVRRLVPIVLIGYLGNAVLPARMGDPVRAVLVGRREAIAVSSAFGSVILERAVDTLTLALIIFPVAAIAGAPTWFVRAAAVAAILAAIVVVVAQTPIPVRVLAAARNRVPAGWDPSLARVERFATGMSTSGRHGALAGAMVLSVLAWLLDGTIYWACGLAVGIDLSPAGAVLISGITALSTAIPSAPGYVGTLELVASTVAQGLGVSPAAALALALLVHAMTVLPLAIGGAVALVWIGARFKDLTAERPDLDPGRQLPVPAEARAR